MLIRRIRDEVHRFGLRFHRDKRSKAALSQEMDSIEGIGKATIDKLLQAFKSMRKISQQSEDALAKTIGKAKAKILYTHFKNKEPGASPGL